jgi:hypothetical protein
VPITTATLTTWIAAIEEGYVAPIAWVRWAEREIEAASYVWPWLVDLFEAKAPEAARAALGAGFGAVPAAETSIDHASLRIGFLWLLYEREDIDATDALERAGRVADGSNRDDPECSAFYGLLDEVAGDGPAEPAALGLNQRIAALFAPHAALARACLRYLD